MKIPQEPSPRFLSASFSFSWKQHPTATTLPVAHLCQANQTHLPIFPTSCLLFQTPNEEICPIHLEASQGLFGQLSDLGSIYPISLAPVVSLDIKPLLTRRISTLKNTQNRDTGILLTHELPKNWLNLMSSFGRFFQWFIGLFKHPYSATGLQSRLNFCHVSAGAAVVSWVAWLVTTSPTLPWRTRDLTMGFMEI